MAQGTDLRAGERVLLTVDIRNAGDATLPAVPVALTVDGNQYADWKLPADLAPGESASWHLVYTGSRGMHLLVATLDPLNDVPEVDQSSKSGFLNLGLGEPRVPFPWLALVFSLLFFVIGAAVGVLLRRPPSVKPGSPLELGQTRDREGGHGPSRHPR